MSETFRPYGAWRRTILRLLQTSRPYGADDCPDLLHAAEEFGGEERDGQLVVACDGEAAARAAARRAADDVGERAVRLYEVEVGGREVFERVAEVAHQRHALEEDFRQHDRRADVQVDAAAVHAPHEFGEQAEVRVRRRAQGGDVRARVEVRDVRADGEVRREGRARAVRRAEQGQIRVLRVRSEQRAPQRLAQTQAVTRALARGLVQEPPRLVRRAERARA